MFRLLNSHFFNLLDYYKNITYFPVQVSFYAGLDLYMSHCPSYTMLTEAEQAIVRINVAHGYLHFG
jgi:hypothetical protein